MRERERERERKEYRFFRFQYTWRDTFEWKKEYRVAKTHRML